ncbi:leucine-rich repeat domain-containing protein [Archangium gephyra]|nr:leucine-rich repeat domain-containing protein [Archangium gephyra]
MDGWMKGRAVGLLAAACLVWGAPAAAQEFSLRIPRLDTAPARVLGIGWDSRDRQFREVCVTGDVAYDASTGSSVLDLQHSLSTYEFHSKLRGTVSAGVDLVLAKGEAEVNITKLVDQSEYTRTLTFSFDVLGRRALLTNLRLTPAGQEAASSGDPDFIRLRCGDEWVMAVELGGQLFLSSRFDFRDEKSRNEFEVAITVSVLGFSHTERFTHLEQDARRNTFLSLEGVQVGGDPSRLNTLLAALRTRRCSLEAIAECDEAVAELVSYASDDSGFRAQLGNLQYQGAGSSVRAYLTRRYADGSFPELAPQPTPISTEQERAALRSLEDKVQETHQLTSRARQLLATRLRPAHQADLLQFLETARWNLATLGNAIDRCYARRVECPQRAQEALAGLTFLDRARLLRPMTTYDYCRLTTRSSGDERLLAALGPLLGASTGDRGDAACVAFETRLDGATALDLRNQDLTELGALRGASALKRLVLRNNRISSLSVVGSLQGLEVLDVTNNDITTLGSLNRLPTLRQVDAGYNLLTTVDGLEGLQQLRWVALHANTVGDADRLKTLPNLSTLVLTVDQRCALERSYVLANGLSDPRTVELFALRNYGPVYVQPANRAAGVMGWAHCSVVTPAY